MEKVEGAKVALQKRDLKLLKYLAENRFATTHMIRKLFFSDSIHHADHRRIRKLKKENLIQDLMGDDQTKLGYKLAPKGIRILKQNRLIGEEESSFKASYRSTFDHDCKLQQIKLILEKSPLLFDYESELSIRKRILKERGYISKGDTLDRIPDALFKIKSSQRVKSGALELELSSKSKRRYLRIFRQLSLNQKLDFVLFVVGNRSLFNKLKVLLQEARKNDGFIVASKHKTSFYFIELENLLKHQGDAIFEGEGITFSFHSLEQNLRKKTEQAA